MGIGRHRELSIPHKRGTRRRLSTGVITEETPPYPTETLCDDVIGAYGKENVFDLQSKSVVAGTMSGVHGLYEHMDVHPSCATNTNHLSGIVLGGWSISPASAIAASSPGEPALDLPVFLFELKDVPRMLKHAYGRAVMLQNAAKGSSISAIKKYLKDPKNPGEDWLNYNFGWRPFMGDAAKIADISAFASNRMKRIDAWNSSKSSTRRQLSVLNGSAKGSGSYDSFTNKSGELSSTRNKESWLVCHWELPVDRYEALRTSRERQIMQALGLDLGVHHVWNAMPWTWLTDWFYDMGSVIEIHSNRFGFKFKNGSIMDHDKWETRITCTTKTGIPDPGVVVRTTEFKTRTHASTFDGHGGWFNFLSANRLATLSSLAVTRGR